MAKVRSEFHIRRDAKTLFEAMDNTTYDRCGKLGPDAQAVLSSSGEVAEFIFTEPAGSHAADTVVGVAFFGGAGTQMQLRLSGTGSKGSHIVAGDDGLIVASGSDSADPLTESEIGVALEDWTDGAKTECDIYRI